jgi:hypothetical protein
MIGSAGEAIIYMFNAMLLVPSAVFWNQTVLKSAMACFFIPSLLLWSVCPFILWGNLLHVGFMCRCYFIAIKSIGYGGVLHMLLKCQFTKDLTMEVML